MSLTQSQTQKLKALMLANSKPAYFIVNEDFKLQAWSDNLSSYGYQGLEKGIDSTDLFDFLVGYDGQEDLELPIVTMPNGVHASVSTVRDGDEINVLILDASYDFQQQYMLQQKANDSQLLNLRLQTLLKELVSAQKELEDKNRQLAEATRLQSRFLSGVSHEFRTPLTSIIGYAEVLIEHLDNDDHLSKAEVMAGNAKYMLSLVENLLDHGRLDSEGLSLQFSSVDLRAFIQPIKDMLQPLAKSKSISLNVNIESLASVFLSIDEVRVQQCIINIVNNAIKFTDTGSVTVGVDWVDDELIVKVVDTGIGMSHEDASNLFKPFWQSQMHDQHGTGLGMTITSRLVDLMGGEIVVQSELNEGTCVRFVIPAVMAEEDCLVDLPFGSNDALEGNEAILLVEDDDDIAGLVNLRLSEWGYKTERCLNGLEAVEWLENNQTDMILMDLSMPVMGGEEALMKIRASGCTTPIYIMSARPLEDGVDIEAQGQILKPINFDQLRKLLVDSFE